MDVHKEVSNILLHHLGETTDRGKHIIPKEYNELHQDISRLVSYTYKIGVAGHNIGVISKIRNDMNNYLKSIKLLHKDFVDDMNECKPKSRGTS